MSATLAALALEARREAEAAWQQWNSATGAARKEAAKEALYLTGRADALADLCGEPHLRPNRYVCEPGAKHLAVFDEGFWRKP